MEENTVLCGANSYVQKYYFNEQFAGLPEGIKKELQILCVLFTEDVGGMITMEFTPKGKLTFKVAAEEEDYLFDEIGSALKIKQYQNEQRELLEGLELYYKAVFLGVDPDGAEDEEDYEDGEEDEKDDEEGDEDD